MEAIWLLAILACPLIMGVMMFLVMRGTHGGEHAAERADEEQRRGGSSRAFSVPLWSGARSD